MGRFTVEFRKFSDGEWYKKTETDSPGAASSVAGSFFGRIGKVTDNETGESRIYDKNVDWDRYKQNGVDLNK